LQIEEIINANEGGKNDFFFENCMFKEENGKMIVEMHYVGHFIV
jgi:hypothetical protein